jgi:ArsR family transcriptional regulator
MAQVNKQEESAAASPAAEPGGGCESDAAACCGSTLSRLLSPQLFKAFADPKRLSLLVRLAEEGRPCTVGQVAEGSGVDLSVVSRHLAVLREAGVIRCVKQGKEVWCSVESSAVVQVLRELADALESCCPTASDAALAAPSTPPTPSGS